MFTNHFLKPGKGIEKNEKKKNGFFQFFFSSYLYFTKIFAINFTALPLIALFGFFMESVKGEMGISVGQSYIFNIFAMVYFTVAGISLLTFPLTLISSYLAKEEPCFFVSDYIKAFKDNFKESLIIFIINSVVFYLFTVSYRFYFINSLGGAMKIGFVAVMGIYLMMNIYIGYLTVTFRLTVGEIYKKALIFTLVNLPQNIMIILILAVVYGLAFMITTLLGYTISSLLLYGFMLLFVNLYASRTVEKYRK